MAADTGEEASCGRAIPELLQVQSAEVAEVRASRQNQAIKLHLFSWNMVRQVS